MYTHTSYFPYIYIYTYTSTYIHIHACIHISKNRGCGTWDFPLHGIFRLRGWSVKWAA